MKAVILAGGYGTRLSEETYAIPKPMIEIGNRPILWHIMKFYSSFGIHDFIILLGYKGYIIKEYFANYLLHQSDVTIDIRSNNIEILNNPTEFWKVTLIDTGLNTNTGGRILRIKEHICKEEFLLTYGDGLSNVNIDQLINFHKKKRAIVTLTVLQPEGRFGSVNLEKTDLVKNFVEKPPGDGGWINGGFFVCEPDVFDYIIGDDSSYEVDVLPKICMMGKLYAYRHSDFWKCMDTQRDKIQLENLWQSGNAPWKTWK